MKSIPTTVVSGSLGAGKTTLILNLVKQLPKDYKTIWLKNEYGDVNIDSELAKSSNIQTQEVLNGCLCCVLVGKLHSALEEIVSKYNPDRLIIETAGTAYPFPILNEIGRVDGLKHDGMIFVVDALNFREFNDKSFLARQQAQFIDLLVINKVGLVEKEDLEIVLDEIYDLYPKTPKVQTEDGFVLNQYLIGLDSKLLQHIEKIESKKDDHHTHTDEVETFSIVDEKSIFDIEKIKNFLESLQNKKFIRIKGILKTNNEFVIVNYVLGRYTIESINNYKGESKIVFMAKSINDLLKKYLTEQIEICRNK